MTVARPPAGDAGACVAVWATAPVPGAIGILQLSADSEEACLRVLRGLCSAPPPIGRPSLRTLAGVDEGVVLRLDPRHAFIMPHGGPGIRTRLTAAAAAAGATVAVPPTLAAESAAAGPLQSAAAALFPEAADPAEALRMLLLSVAASPRGVTELSAGPIHPAEWLPPAARWRLVRPATVAVCGRPNAGKSTLLNALVGRSAARTAPTPGTTRDAVGADVEMLGVVVHWLDTPGARGEADGAEAMELEAIGLAAPLIAAADLLVFLAEPHGGWPAPTVRAVQAAQAVRAPDLRVLSKADLPGADQCPEAAEASLRISARSGLGLDALAAAVVAALLPGLRVP